MFLTIPAKAGASVTTEFLFSGTCQDCTGFGTGDLVLSHYTLGNTATWANFVSFSYTSNLTTFSIAREDISSFSATFDASQALFISMTSGAWCTGYTCLADYAALTTSGPRCRNPPRWRCSDRAWPASA